MARITLKEARKRSNLDLISDKDIGYYDHRGVPTNVRESQKETEKRYPAHKYLREHSIKYFLAKEHDVYPRGIAIRNIYASPDYAIFKKEKLIFVECLTAHMVRTENTVKKRKVEPYAEIIFVVEDPSIVNFVKSYHKRDYIERIRCLKNKCKVFCCNSESGIIKKFI